MAVIETRKDMIASGISAVKSEANPPNKRRSLRVVIDVPISVFGQNAAGKIFEEKTRTITVSDHGGLIFLKADVDPERPTLLVNPKTGAEIQCRIAHRKEVEKGLFQIGVEFATPLPRFWGVNFPPEDWNPSERKQHTVSRIPSPTLSEGKKK